MMKPLEEMGKYAVVVIDPPWDITISRGLKDNKSSGLGLDVPYQTMKIEDIKAIPIENVLSNDSLLFLWTTSRLLPEAFGIIETWGCKYWYTLVWVKGGGPQLPGTPCFNAEYAIVGRRGGPVLKTTKQLQAANMWPRRLHSEKPEEFYDLLRRTTHEPRLDIFGRRRIAGFTSWGDQAPKDEPMPSHYQDVFEH